MYTKSLFKRIVVCLLFDFAFCFMFYFSLCFLFCFLLRRLALVRIATPCVALLRVALHCHAGLSTDLLCSPSHLLHKSHAQGTLAHLSSGEEMGHTGGRDPSPTEPLSRTETRAQECIYA